MKSIKIVEKKETPEDTHWLSPSQLEAYRDCPACWARTYVAGKKSPQSYYALLGTTVHTVLEKYLKTGELDVGFIWGKKAQVPIGAIAQSGIKYLPSPKSTEYIEQDFHIQIEDVFFRGKIDFLYQKDGTLVVGDHKTKTNLDKALDTVNLQENSQAVIYSAFAQTFFNVEINELHWIYYLTKGPPAAKLVKTEVSKKDIERNLDSILTISREIVDAKKNKKLEDFRPPETGCKSWKEKDQICFYEELKMTEKRKLQDLLNVKAEQKEAIKVAEEIPAAEEKGFTLLIDCLPRKGFDKVIEFTEILKEVFAKISETKNVSHHTFIQFEARGVFVTTLDKYLSENPIPDGSVVVMTLTPDARDALDVLIEHGARVVQAVSR